MPQVILIRPGSTDYDQQERIQGNLDIPLNEEGLAEVAQLIDQLRDKNVEVLYTSTTRAAEQTAEAIAEALDIRLRKLDRMENIDLGLWQGMLLGEVKQKQPRVYRQWQESPETVCPPEGETLAQAEERVRTCLTKQFRRWRGATIGLVLPEPLLSLARHYVTHAELGNLWNAGEGRPLFEVLQWSGALPVTSG
jgi:broad specificity phosphatase PhoE